jgi:CRISPR-associated protein Cas2
MFDLPTDTSEDRKIASEFRKKLLKDGFWMLQFSIYVRHSFSLENAQVHIGRVKKWLPDKGEVSIIIMKITDKQFGMIEFFHGARKEKPLQPAKQLTLF